MNSIDFIPDKDLIIAALQRVIIVDGRPVTSVDFAKLLFSCGKDVLPFEDTLTYYGYSESYWERPEDLKAIITCYNMGNVHTKRELTSRMLHETDPSAQSRVDLVLKKVWAAYVVEEDAPSSMDINIHTVMTDSEDDKHPENKDVIVENEVPDAEEL